MEPAGREEGHRQVMTLVGCVYVKEYSVKALPQSLSA